MRVDRIQHLPGTKQFDNRNYAKKIEDKSTQLDIKFIKIDDMKLSIDINENLIAKAQELSKSKTKKATVEKALRLLLSFNDPQKIVDILPNKSF